MKKILIQHFPSLDNYGTAMMGLVMSQFLFDHFGGDVEIYADLNSDAIIPEVLTELKGAVQIKRYQHPYQTQFRRSSGLMKRFWQLYSLYVYKEFDLIIILGGDDISEYYSRYGALSESFKCCLLRFYCPVVLVGQTIGPFNRFFNRQLLPCVLRPLPIITRDQWCYDYLRKDLKLGKNLYTGADLAFCDLPLQHDHTIEQKILEHYGLVPNQYITINVSGSIGSYCQDEHVYFQTWRDIICRLAKNTSLQGKKICLLAHTFSMYGEEGKNIARLYQQLPGEVQQQVILVKERILPVRARLILGNGYLTLTGRMHASISTFQMGKPAIALSYSKKYGGIIGQNLKQPDLIIEADRESGLWEDKKIADKIDEKIHYVCGNYDSITGNIKEQAALQKQLAESSLQQCVGFAKCQVK